MFLLLGCILDPSIRSIPQDFLHRTSCTRLLAKISPRWPRWPQDGPNLAQDGSKMVPKGYQDEQDWPILFQDGLTLAEDGSKVTPSWP